MKTISSLIYKRLFPLQKRNGQRRSRYQITQNVIARDRPERHASCFFGVRSVLILARTKSNHPHYPWKPSTHPHRSFRTYPFSPLLTSDYRLPRAPFLSYMCNALWHKRAQGNSCDYGGMIPSGLTRLLTKLFDRTNSGMPRGGRLVETQARTVMRQ